jgi:hypothetical protein
VSRADTRAVGLEAFLALEVAVQQLLTPSVESLDRYHPDHDPDTAEVLAAAARSHRERMTQLRAAHAKARGRRDKAGARRALARVIAAETEYRDAVAARTRLDAVVPSLLARLQAAVESTQGHGTRGGGAHRSPIGLSAAELIGHIERTVGDRGPRLEIGVRHWAYERRGAGPDDLAAAAATATRWVEDARGIVEPDRSADIKGKCPVCRYRWVWAEVDGQRVRKAALQLSYATRSARCINPACSGRWTEHYLDHLARVVEQDVDDDDERTAG